MKENLANILSTIPKAIDQRWKVLEARRRANHTSAVVSDYDQMPFAELVKKYMELQQTHDEGGDPGPDLELVHAALDKKVRREQERQQNDAPQHTLYLGPREEDGDQFPDSVFENIKTASDTELDDLITYFASRGIGGVYDIKDAVFALYDERKSRKLRDTGAKARTGDKSSGKAVWETMMGGSFAPSKKRDVNAKTQARRHGTPDILVENNKCSQPSLDMSLIAHASRESSPNPASLEKRFRWPFPQDFCCLGDIDAFNEQERWNLRFWMAGTPEVDNSWTCCLLMLKATRRRCDPLTWDDFKGTEDYQRGEETFVKMTEFEYNNPSYKKRDLLNRTSEETQLAARELDISGEEITQTHTSREMGDSERSQGANEGNHKRGNEQFYINGADAATMATVQLDDLANYLTEMTKHERVPWEQSLITVNLVRKEKSTTGNGNFELGRRIYSRLVAEWGQQHTWDEYVKKVRDERTKGGSRPLRDSWDEYLVPMFMYSEGDLLMLEHFPNPRSAKARAAVAT